MRSQLIVTDSNWAKTCEYKGQYFAWFLVYQILILAASVFKWGWLHQLIYNKDLERTGECQPRLCYRGKCAYRNISIGLDLEFLIILIPDYRMDVRLQPLPTFHEKASCSWLYIHKYLHNAKGFFFFHQFIRSAHMNYLYAVLKMILKHYKNSISVFTVGFHHFSIAAW